ncbi:unnamed protein product [Vitrella brassicaformis CCMP3155]|uniref:GH16 domain-containing protein n=1 Tax=Vitrella brassicaformis (strain CCMP3155) TaxID=1169540 RepID=A0A0G4E850_VITBC|nr:unnamed protein product [Vitrella brassicaformis CCMP3155]|eukprot:CEL91619.1 unnamed protein product [Vitrella brassicaformis CCMP3155]
MGFLAFLAAVAITLTCVFCQPKQEEPPDGKELRSPWVPEGYERDWEHSDEFDGDKLDMNKWLYREECGPESCQLPEMVSLVEGNLRVQMSRLEKPVPVPSGNYSLNYAGGGVITKDALPYGYFEARIKFWEHPGFWMSFWAATAESIDKEACQSCKNVSQPRQEIDLFEHNGGVNAYQYNFIKWHPVPRIYVAGRRIYPDTEINKEFHVWGMEHTPIETRLYLDGVLFGSADWNTMYVREMSDFHYWLSAIITIHITHCITDESKLPGEMLVDYFRYYRPKTGPKFVFSEPDGEAAKGKAKKAKGAPEKRVRVGGTDCRGGGPLLAQTPASLTRLHEFTLSFWVKHGKQDATYVPYVGFSRSDSSNEDILAVELDKTTLVVTIAGSVGTAKLQVEDFWNRTGEAVPAAPELPKPTRRRRALRQAQVATMTAPPPADDEGKEGEGKEAKGGSAGGSVPLEWEHVGVTWSSQTGQVIVYRNARVVTRSSAMKGKVLPRDGQVTLGRVLATPKSAPSLVGELSNVKLFSRQLTHRDLSTVYFCLNVFGDLADTQWSTASIQAEGGVEVSESNDARCPSPWEGPAVAPDVVIPIEMGSLFRPDLVSGLPSLHTQSSLTTPTTADTSSDRRQLQQVFHGDVTPEIVNCVGEEPAQYFFPKIRHYDINTLQQWESPLGVDEEMSAPAVRPPPHEKEDADSTGS